ncbi:MAG: DUF4347 domain-containing protein, partial [Dolichospermum sp.]
MSNNSFLRQTATTIVFIDASLSDYHTLQAGIIEGVKTVIISPEQNGIEQISQILQQHPHITTIHILSHGAPGCLYLGNSQLNLTNIHNYTQQLQQWQPQNILLYGCNVASGDAGAEFIHKLHQITKATISASTTKTGNAALGGNWQLEVSFPVTETFHGTSLHLSDIVADTLNSYQGVFAPTLVGNYNTSDWARGVQVVGNYAYVADSASRLQILDRRNPSTPTRQGKYNTSGAAFGVQVVSNYAYVADVYSGLQIIDISNPTTPTLKGNYDTSGYAQGVQVVGNYAYVADGGTGLQIIDISNPSTPTLKGNYNTSGNARGVQVVGNYAYVADSGSGLQIIDVSEFTNKAPTNLTLSTSTVAENQIIGTVIGNLTTTDTDTANTFTYSLVTGDGATDNSLFTITNNQLTTNAVFDFETKNSYSVRLRTTDQGGLFFERQLTIGVTDLNETPTNLTLSNSTVAENQIIGTVIGNLSTTDPDTANTFTYSLVPGTGATDNSLFTISGNQLRTNAVFDFETKNSYSIRLRTTDQSGLFFERQLTIGVNNVNETPTNLTLSTSTVAENQIIGTVVGNLTTTDTDTGNTFTYSLVTGNGATDNSLFTISGNQLRTNSVFDFETKNSYSIRVRTTDQGELFFEKQLTIGVTDLNDNESFTTTAQQDIIDADYGDDTITSTFANLQQNDTIKGGNGTDTLIITGGTVNDLISIDTSNTTNQLDIPGTTVFGFERFDLTSFAGTISFDGTTGNDWI